MQEHKQKNLNELDTIIVYESSGKKTIYYSILPEEYPQNKTIEIDDWCIVTEGVSKGLYHSCSPNNKWKSKVNHNIDAICPHCLKETPKDIDSLAAVLRVI